MSAAEKPDRTALYVFAVAAAVFATGLAGRGLWHPDEHRYTEIARVMTEPGADLLVPHLNRAEYSDKPPLMFWMIALVRVATGLDLAIAARIPSVLGGAGAVALTFAIGRRLWGRSAGLAAALALVTIGEFNWLAQRANLDALVTFFTTLAMWGFARAAFPAPTDRVRPATGGALVALAVGVGVLVKGPISIVLPAVSIVTFAVWKRRWRLLGSTAALGVLAVVPVGVWLIAAGRHAGWQYVHDIAVTQWFGHPAGQVDKVDTSPLFYFVKVPLEMLPWTFLVPAAVVAFVRWRRDEERDADALAIAWVAAQFALLTISKAKRDLYALPLLPGTALLLGRTVAAVTAGGIERLKHPAVAFGRFAMGGLGVLAGSAVALAGAVVLAGRADAIFGRFESWPVVRAGATTTVAVAAVLVGATLAVSAGWSLCAREPLPCAKRLAAALVAGALMFALVVLPAADPCMSPRPFVEEVGRRIGDAPLADYGGGEYAPNWILGRDFVAPLHFVEKNAARRGARFLDSAKPGPAYLVCDRGYVTRRGMPANAEVLLTWPRVLDDDLLLLGRVGTDHP